MPWKRRTFRRFTSARSRRRGSWNGFTLNGTLADVTPNAHYLWDDVTSSTLNLQGRGVHQRTIIRVMINIADAAVQFPQIAWYLYVFKTDATGNVPAAMLFSPWGGQIVLQKELMDWGMIGFQPTTIQGSSYAIPGQQLPEIHRDIKVKRKLTDTDALMWVMEARSFTGSALTLPIRFTMAARTYVSF